MANLKWHLSVGFLMAVSLVGSKASAQSVALSFAELQPLLKEGQMVIVTDGAGRTTKGKIKALSPSSFSLVSASLDPARTFGDGALSAHMERDGLKNGIWAGVAAGFLTSAVAGAMVCNTGGRDCTDSPLGSLGAALSYSIVFVPAGIGIGALVDSLVRHDELHVDYRAGGSARRSMRIAPWFGKRDRGLSLSIGF